LIILYNIQDSFSFENGARNGWAGGDPFHSLSAEKKFLVQMNSLTNHSVLQNRGAKLWQTLRRKRGTVIKLESLDRIDCTNSSNDTDFERDSLNHSGENTMEVESAEAVESLQDYVATLSRKLSISSSSTIDMIELPTIKEDAEVKELSQKIRLLLNVEEDSIDKHQGDSASQDLKFQTKASSPIERSTLKRSFSVHHLPSEQRFDLPTMRGFRKHSSSSSKTRNSIAVMNSLDLVLQNVESFMKEMESGSSTKNGTLKRANTLMSPKSPWDNSYEPVIDFIEEFSGPEPSIPDEPEVTMVTALGSDEKPITPASDEWSKGFMPEHLVHMIPKELLRLAEDKQDQDDPSLSPEYISESLKAQRQKIVQHREQFMQNLYPENIEETEEDMWLNHLVLQGAEPAQAEFVYPPSIHSQSGTIFASAEEFELENGELNNPEVNLNTESGKPLNLKNTGKDDRFAAQRAVDPVEKHRAEINAQLEPLIRSLSKLDRTRFAPEAIDDMFSKIDHMREQASSVSVRTRKTLIPEQTTTKKPNFFQRIGRKIKNTFKKLLGKSRQK
jgi:hypothetical protein